MNARAPLLLLALCSACVSFDYVRFSYEEPLPDAAVAALAPGAPLQDCLAALGAPQWVWEQPDGRLALGYAWFDQVDWGFSVSWSLTDFASVSFEFDSDVREVPGVVLLFDAAWQLAASRRGFMADITRDLRRRPPAAIE